MCILFYHMQKTLDFSIFLLKDIINDFHFIKNVIHAVIQAACAHV